MVCVIAGIAWCVAEAWWERRARAEALGRTADVSPLLRRWRALSPQLADDLHREHFLAEIAMSRDAVWGTLPALAAADLILGARAVPIAMGLAALPLTKLLWQGRFNAVESALPPFAELSRLRDLEVRRGLQGDDAGARTCRRERRALQQRLLGALNVLCAAALYFHAFSGRR